MIANSAIEPMANSAAREFVFDFIKAPEKLENADAVAHFMACDGEQSIVFANGKIYKSSLSSSLACLAVAAPSSAASLAAAPLGRSSSFCSIRAF